MKLAMQEFLAVPLVVAALAAGPASATVLNGPIWPAPGGTNFTDSGGNAGDAGGTTFNFSGFDPSQFSALYWGADDSQTPSDAIGAGLDGTLHPMTFSNASGTTAYWDTTSASTNPTTLVTSTQTIWLAIDVTGLGASPWVDAGSLGLSSWIGDVANNSSGAPFSANLQFTVGASPGGTPIDNLQQPANSSNLTQTSFYGAFYYAAPVATVPEPGTLASLGIGLLGLGLVTRKRNKTDGCFRWPSPPPAALG